MLSRPGGAVDATVALMPTSAPLAGRVLGVGHGVHRERCAPPDASLVATAASGLTRGLLRKRASYTGRLVQRRAWWRLSTLQSWFRQLVSVLQLLCVPDCSSAHTTKGKLGHHSLCGCHNSRA